MSDLIAKYDVLLHEDGPAALILHRNLESIEGKNAWIFPPTFAASTDADDDDESGGGRYQIDDLGNGENVCLIDSIGSQANRMEPVFKDPPYSNLVPQITIKMNDGECLNLLDAGHRAADASIRFSKLCGPQFRKAFEKLRDEGDCSHLASLAPTSLVFGVWDSRGTQMKCARIVRSVIRAYNVKKALRSATYRSACEYTENGNINPELDKGKGKDNPLSQEGFKSSLASDTHGGIRAERIRQEAIINLVTLRSLTSSIELRRHLLGLALVALSYRSSKTFNLREGCLLKACSPEDFGAPWQVEFVDGRPPQQLSITPQDALEYATAQASQRNIQPTQDTFDSETANAWLKLSKADRKKYGKKFHPQAALVEMKAKPKKEKTQSDTTQVNGAEASQ